MDLRVVSLCICGSVIQSSLCTGAGVVSAVSRMASTDPCEFSAEMAGVHLQSRSQFHADWGACNYRCSAPMRLRVVSIDLKCCCDPNEVLYLWRAICLHSLSALGCLWHWFEGQQDHG